MAKSQSESPLVSLAVKLRGARGVTEGFAEGRQQCLARAEDTLPFVIARNAATEQSRNGQPDMRQA